MNRIMLDLDDVLNSLTLHVLRYYGCPVGPFEYEAFPVDVGYDMISACKMLGGNAPDTPAAFWDTVTEANLWRSAPKSPQCDMLLEMSADAVGKDNVYIATTPTKDAQAHAEKLYWMWDNLPEWIHRQYFITPRKWLLGKPGVALFDDHIDNCEKFYDEGGTSFIVPRPWNPCHDVDTSKTIQGAFKVMRDEK